MTAPVLVSSWMYAGQAGLAGSCLTVALPPPPKVAGAPPMVSSATMLLSTVPPATPPTVPLSATVTIALLPTDTGGVVTVQVPVPVQAGSPPPVAVAVLVPLVAAAPTVTGTRMTMVPLEALVSIWQPVKLVPVAGQPLKAPLLVLLPCFVGAPDKLMPVGKLSLITIAALVGPLATVTVMS